MKRGVRISVAIAAALVLLAGGFAWYSYTALNPQEHFAKIKQYPVLGANQPAASPAGTTSSQQTAQTREKQNQSSFNVLLLGIDTWQDDASRSDVIMVMHVNPATKQVTLVSIPRDTRVDLPGIGFTKINHAHFVGELTGNDHSGTEAAVQAVDAFLGIQMNYYIKTNFSGFKDFIDQIGGIDVELPEQVGKFAQGPHHFDGTDALEFVRERYSLQNGDFGRQADQDLMLRAIADKLLTPKELPALPGLAVKVRHDWLDTNFTNEDLLSLAFLLKDVDSSQFHYVQIPGQNGVFFDPLVEADLDYWVPDRKAVQEIQKSYFDH